MKLINQDCCILDNQRESDAPSGIACCAATQQDSNQVVKVQYLRVDISYGRSGNVRTFGLLVTGPYHATMPNLLVLSLDYLHPSQNKCKQEGCWKCASDSREKRASY